MRIFISLALIIIILSVKIRANDDIYSTTLIDVWVITYYQSIKHSYTPAALSDGIPDAERFPTFFQRLSDNFMKACEMFEKAQFFVSAVRPSNIALENFNKVIEEFDQTYQGYQNREIMKADVIAMRNQLIEYGAEIAPFRLVPFNWFDGTNYRTWLQGHRNDFGTLRNDKKLAEYLKHVNDLIITIQKSIAKSHRKIEHRQLKRLGTKILRGVERFLNSVVKVEDVTSSIAEIRNATNGVRNTNNGKYFNDMKTNARKILEDLDQLRLLMEIQWTHMDYIFRTQESPQQLPTVTLAN